MLEYYYHGVVAHLGERIAGSDEVASSSLVSSTIFYFQNPHEIFPMRVVSFADCSCRVTGRIWQRDLFPPGAG